METTQRRIIREAECKEITGLSRTTRYTLARNGDFPSPIALTPGIGRRSPATGWWLDEVLAWLESRPRLNVRSGPD